ncbi:MAG: hypothetical protein ABSA52_23070, partial [Candidatus Binatia bacterium]
YPASFSVDLAVATLPFVWVAATNFPEDFHLLSTTHAGRTKKEKPRQLRLSSSSWVRLRICRSGVRITPGALIFRIALPAP